MCRETEAPLLELAQGNSPGAELRGEVLLVRELLLVLLLHIVLALPI
jgi:hypothetical protein